MKILKVGFLFSSFCVLSLVFLFLVKDKITPGYTSNSLEDLDPNFRLKVELVTERLEAQGYSFRISETFRSQERQDFIYSFYERLSKKIGLDIRITSTRVSRHSRTIDGKPAACAIDLRPVGLYSIKKRADFYIALRDESVAIGLRSGANFERKGYIYGRFGLGYDPGHISDSCSRT